MRGNASTIAGNASTIAGNASTIAGNTSSIAGNASAIVGNASTIAGNASTMLGHASVSQISRSKLTIDDRCETVGSRIMSNCFDSNEKMIVYKCYSEFS